ncbi:hypothetical protein LCGC14_0273490 [marine sediment metagenome]
MPDGKLIEGEGQDAPGGLRLSNLAEDAVAARFVRGSTDVYIAGPVDLHWSVQKVHAIGPDGATARLTSTSRALVLRSLDEDARVFIMPDGAVNIARTVEQAGVAYEAITRALLRSRV